MIIAIYGRQFSEEYIQKIQEMVSSLEQITKEFIIYDKLFDFLNSKVCFNKPIARFSSYNEIPKETFCLISIGGDGTLLDTLTLIKDSNIPVLGINIGRLGFLSAVAIKDITEATNCIISQNYRIDPRSVIKLASPVKIFEGFPYALNELTIMKRDTSSMITIKVSVNNEYLNTYWADGLIIATPTGSTGYSLSCGGPIISPESQNFIITPIASHNLTVRPIVIPDNSKIKISVEGRTKDYLLVMDSRSIAMDETVELEVCKAEFGFNLIFPKTTDFYQTIRNKLAWGLDKRN
jgi:NAD+ kinase